MSHGFSKAAGVITAVCALTIFTFCVHSVNACSVPVFRYALEHWQPDPYLAVVFHRGELTDEQQALIDLLQPSDADGRPTVNLIVKTVDLDQQQSDVVLELWQQHESDTLPLLSLQTPPKHGPPQTTWFGELTSENVVRLMHSPARQTIQENLLGGDSVVWVFLDSGEQVEDDTAFQLLNQELTRLQDVIELPAIDQQDLGDLSIDPAALKIAFSSVRISRDDEQERALVEMLLRVEADLRDEPFIHQPMAFPVFARGRALYALVGDGITPETIEDASRFLTGACQCTVKAQNPGVDLMLNVDWEQLVQPALPYDDAPPTLAGLTSFASPQPDSVEASEHLAVTASPLIDTQAQAEASPEAGSALAVVDTTASADLDKAPVAVHAAETETTASSGGEESLVRNITVFLGLICAGVVAVTLFVVTRK